MIRKCVVVRGLVQGIGFRYRTRHEAAELGLAGFVRNRADGAVEAEIEGDEDAVSILLEHMASGPPGAVIESVEVSDHRPTGDTEFRIEH